MDKFFKCDCGGHILHAEYLKASKKFDFEEFALGIYSIYNDKGDRKLKIPKLLGDVVIFNNASPKELDKFFDFMWEVIKNRRETKKPIASSPGCMMKPLDTSIKNLNKYLKKKRKKDQEEFKKRIEKNKKANRKKK